MPQKSKYIINSVLWTLISTVISGAMFQTFLLKKGMEEETVGQIVSLMQFVQMTVIFVFSKFIDKVKNVIRFTAASHLLYLPLFLAMAALCFTTGNRPLLLMITAVIACFGAGLYNVLSYKIPFHIMDMKDYGVWTGVSAVVAAVFMLALTVALSLFQKQLGYFPTMRWFYPLATAGAVLFAVMTASYKSVDFLPKTDKQQKIALLRYRPFTLLIVPNLIRGFCAGVIALAVTIGSANGQLEKNTAAVLLVITQTVGIPANYLYTKLTGREPILILTGSIGLLGAVSFIGLFRSTGFLVCYGVAYFCLCIINVAVPVLVARVVDYRVVGQYNGWRIMLNTAGIFLASAVCMPLVKALGASAVWITAGVMQLISGGVYYCYGKRLLADAPAQNTTEESVPTPRGEGESES